MFDIFWCVQDFVVGEKKKFEDNLAIKNKLLRMKEAHVNIEAAIKKDITEEALAKKKEQLLKKLARVQEKKENAIKQKAKEEQMRLAEEEKKKDATLKESKVLKEAREAQEREKALAEQSGVPKARGSVPSWRTSVTATPVAAPPVPTSEAADRTASDKEVHRYVPPSARGERDRLGGDGSSRLGAGREMGRDRDIGRDREPVRESGWRDRDTSDSNRDRSDRGDRDRGDRDRGDRERGENSTSAPKFVGRDGSKPSK
jgi:hypothetical protein